MDYSSASWRVAAVWSSLFVRVNFVSKESCLFSFVVVVLHKSVFTHLYLVGS